MVAEDSGVVARLSSKQDDPVDATIAPLGLHTPLESLHVMEPIRGVDADRPWAVEPDVPCS